jgi:ADP-ribose pyrophosphatase YjhB (NUDIX family)
MNLSAKKGAKLDPARSANAAPSQTPLPKSPETSGGSRPKGLPREQNLAYVYLTCGSELLVFRQTDFPDVGLQIPGGVALEDEEPQATALRCFAETTGLSGLQNVSWLGEAAYVFTRIRTKYTRHRQFFHATLPELRQKRWSATGPSPDGSGRPIRLGYFVTPVFNGELALADELDAFLPAVRTAVRAAI